MNIDILINQHSNWKSLVEGLFHNNDADILDPKLISRDSECDFGKWIYICFEEKRDLSSSPLMHKIMFVHKQFHLITGRIVYSFQASKIEEAKSLITTFNKTSDELIQLMEELRIELNKEQSC